MTDITPLPTPPSTADPVNFATRADTFLGALPDFADEMNAYGGKLNSFSTNSTSTTSLAIGTGSKSLTVTTGKSYVTGMYIRVVSTSTPTNYMQGTVTSYNSGTGALVFNSEITGGSGTIASWTISMSVNPADRPAGTVLQVVQGTTSTTVTVSTSTYTDSGLSASITPTKASSKILVIVNQPIYLSRDVVEQTADYRLVRDSTPVLTVSSAGYIYVIPSSDGNYLTVPASLSYLDSPSTTSSITYKTQGAARYTSSNGYISFQDTGDGQTSVMILMEIAG
jgi:hypothetical protein